jgi:carbamoyltransferase
MNIIGISGLDGAVPFKKSHWPRLDEREYRISQGHDSAAALVIDGHCVAAAAEERFTRQKHTGAFPVNALNYCLSATGLSLSEIVEIAHGFDYSPYKIAYSLDRTSSELYEQVLSRDALLQLVQRNLPGVRAERVHQVDHHLAHASSAYFTSGWDESLVAIVDAMGEAHGASIYVGRDGKLNLIRQIPSNDSIGILYSLVTLHLGFDFNSDEYKIMGLAPYGDPARFRHFFETSVELHPDGLIRIPLLHVNRTREERENYLRSRSHLATHLCPVRMPEDEITQVHCDAAAALQECLDRTTLHICGHFGRTTGLRRLAMAGGVALNCTANGKLLRSGLFDEIYVQPASGDDGTALGAALYRAAQNGEIRNGRFPVPFLGPAPAAADIDAAIHDFQDRIVVSPFSSLQETCAAAAELINSGQVVAWYRGRMEYGPRALGHRSILADPGDPGIRDRLNSMVKMREAFRPFAPAVTLEQAHRWFDVPAGMEFPYMIFNVDVQQPYRSLLPAITHVNGTARLQTVSLRDNCEFHTLLRAVGKLSGREMVVNTSFNVKGQPIVSTPREAMETYLGTGIDAMFMEEFQIRRREI